MNGSEEQISPSSVTRADMVKWRRFACHLAAIIGGTEGAKVRMTGICEERYYFGVASSTTGVHSFYAPGTYFFERRELQLSTSGDVA